MAIGDALTAFPRGVRSPRRGPDPDARPFDAVGIAIREADLPTDRKSTTALLIEVRERLLTPPWIDADMEERKYLVAAGLDELRRRGLDADLAVRHGFGPGFTGIITILLIFPHLKNPDAIPTTYAEAAVRVPKPWVDALGLGGGSLDMRALVDVKQRIENWVLTAPIDDLIYWNPPSAQPSRATDAPEAAARATWIVDRFTQTYLYDWSKSSLLYEWRYIYSLEPGPLSPEAMCERRIDRDDLHFQIASNASEEWPSEGGTPAAAQLDVNALTAHVIAKLREDENEAALAVAEAIAGLRPDDPAATNNMGFCVLPFDPSRALTVLREAQRLGFDSAINPMNQVVAALRMEDRSELAAAVAQVIALSFDRAEIAFVWMPIGDELAFVGPLPLGEYWPRLYAAVAEFQARP
jgi:hypothetical protein